MPTQAVRFMKLKPAVSISTFGWCHMKEHVSFRAGSTCDLLMVFPGILYLRYKETRAARSSTWETRLASLPPADRSHENIPTQSHEEESYRRTF